ncbi:hypothetical protein D9M70_569690 [compost metagenome]
MAIDDLDTAVFRRVRPNANLDRILGIDNSIPHGTGYERTVIDPLAIVKPCILMCIELNQCQRTIFRSMGFE